MQAHDLETYLHTYIPLTQAMQVSVLSIAPEQLVLQAPLKPNINPHHTVFGGSVATMATLAAWCLVYSRLTIQGIEHNLVVRRSSLEYERPIAGDFTATASLENPELWDKFVSNLQQHGKAKIALESVLTYAGQITGRFKGEFVALQSLS